MSDPHESALRADSRVLLTELKDGTGLLLHLGTKLYFTLNETGVLVWKTLVAGPATRHRLVDVIAERYEAPRETIDADVAAIVEELIGDQLVRPD
ncbi:MAG: PqqD family protein [Deltaproteobacteria bacterium]|nr:PqqD family protein [Deltaproteobacteria bacterium]